MNTERVFYIIVAIMSIIGILMSVYYLGMGDGFTECMGTHNL